ncbi:MAG TPA: hypothetical protein P5048_00475 [Chlamydiales bacterium]|nr:hypothetical protein [Chlamydiales bacterium]
MSAIISPLAKKLERSSGVLIPYLDFRGRKETDVHNFEAIVNVVDQSSLSIYLSDGKIKRMNFLQKIFYKHIKSYTKMINADLKNELSDLVNRLRFSGDRSEIEALVVHVFLRSLANLSEDIFDRSKISDIYQNELMNSVCKYDKDLKEIDDQVLSARVNIYKINQKIKSLFATIENQEPQLIEGMDEKLEELQNNLEICQQTLFQLEKMKLAVKKTKLSIAMRMPFSNGNGFSGSYIIKDLKGKNIGIYKPSDEDFLSLSFRSRRMKFWHFIRNCIKRIPIASNFLGGTLNEGMGGQGHLGEVAAYVLDRELGLGIVPPTVNLHLAVNDNLPLFEMSFTSYGSFQLFEEKAQSGTDFYGISKHYKPVDITKTYEDYESQLDPKWLGKLAIFDFLIGNLDRHAENFMVAVDEKNPKKGTHLFAIDNGMSFHVRHSDHPLERRNQYCWAKFILAQRKFFSEEKELIKLIYDRRFELIEMVYSKLIQEGQDERFACCKRTAMWERIEALYSIAVIQDCSLSDLINYRKSSDIQQAINMNS